MATAGDAMDVDGEAHAKGFDEQLYNRQEYAIGADAQRRLGRCDVLVCGLTGLGMEAVKNVALTGVRSVTLFDSSAVQWTDLSSAFYFKEADVGKNRVDSCIAQLQQLNKYCQIRKLAAPEFSESAVEQWRQASLAEHPDSKQVILFADHFTTSAELVAINAFCRQRGVKFISTESRGVAGCIFVDNGDKHVVFDVDGEEVKTCLVTGITSENPAMVKVHEDNRHELSEGDAIMFFDLDELPEFNNASPDVPDPKTFRVKVTGPFTFTLHTVGADGALVPVDGTKIRYSRGGYCLKVKLPAEQSFLSLADSIQKPEFLITDFAKFEAPGILHGLFLALHDFAKAHAGQMPDPHDAAQAAEVAALAKGRAAGVADCGYDEALVTSLATVSRGAICPMAALLGGFAAHEVLKAASGKFSPIKQWFYFDARECLIATPHPAPETCKLTGTRYDGNIAVFGSEFQERLRSLNYFCVGAGALGCEFMKNFAMIGVGCSAKGSVVVTDMDSIEKSNLSRQFLFRNNDVGRQKAECAAAAAKVMNPDLNVRHLCDKVAPDTEQTFDDGFWAGLDGVMNALDNIQARLYVDSRCVYFQKSLLESGTLGSKGNVQVVVPELTESYGSSRDPPEKSIPICTLKNFPNAIEHTIQWSRDQFEGLFQNVPKDVNSYLTDATFLQQLEREPGMQMPTLESVLAATVTERPKDFVACVDWARNKFEELFVNTIKQVLHNLPLDMRTNSGDLFWSGPKRPPAPCSFTVDDPTHLGFVSAAANLRAFTFSIPQVRQMGEVAKMAAAIKVPEFKPRQAKIQIDEKEKVEEDPLYEKSLTKEDIIAKLPPAGTKALAMIEVDFEKDDDSNFHMDFITACSNLRARNYKIPEADKSKTKLIAGKIIPAMVTTTSLVTGLVSFELLKLAQKDKKLEDYKNAFVNLAIPFVTLSEPMKCPVNTYGPEDKPYKWTLWSRFDVDEGKDITLQQLINHFEKKHELSVSMISAGTCIIYSFFQQATERKKRLAMPCSEVVKMVSKQEFGPTQNHIIMELSAEYDDDDVETPSVRYKFRGW